VIGHTAVFGAIVNVFWFLLTEIGIISKDGETALFFTAFLLFLILIFFFKISLYKKFDEGE